MQRRAWARLGFLIPLAIALAAFYGITTVRTNADQRRQGQLLLTRIEAAANRQGVLISKVSELGVLFENSSNADPEFMRRLSGLPQDINEVRSEIEANLARLGELHPLDRDLEDVSTAVRYYETQLDEQIAILDRQDFDEAWIFDRRRLDPAFEKLREAINAADRQYSTLANQANSMANIGTLLILLLTLVALGFLQFERKRRAAVVVAAEQQVLTDSEARFRSLVQNSADVFVITDRDLVMSYCSPSIQRLLGFQSAEMEGRSLTDLAHPDDAHRLIELQKLLLVEPDDVNCVECRIAREDGSIRDVELTGSNSIDVPKVTGFVITARDITERKEAERERKALELQLEHQAFHDPLTNLANRVLFKDRVDHALARSSRTREQLAVLFVDLDGFKQVNDTAGHQAGDLVLVEVSKRLRSCLRDADTVARLGGDEFAILIEGVVNIEDVYVLTDRMLESLMMPFELQGHHLLVGGSIGLALSGDAILDAETLLANADVAMYEAKARGKGCRELYRPDMRSDLLGRLSLGSELQRAMDKNEFVVHYQPIVGIRSGKIMGVEALVRWIHPERGVIPPGEFISVAEDSGLILPLGQWVLEQACSQARAWQIEFPQDPPICVSVNLSVRQFQQSNLSHAVEQVLHDSGLPPACLVLEITESILIQDTAAAVHKLQGLRDLGVQLALDDFGTGFSSLSYLNRFPIDILKIDKSFIDGIGARAEDAALTRAIVQIGETLKLRTVAEGIEHAEQRVELEGLGCEEGQGFYFSRPVDSEAMSRLFAESLLESAG